MSNWGIILAAGLGARMGSPKAFLLIDGKPMILHSLISFQQSSSVHGIVAVCRREDCDRTRSIAEEAGILKLKAVVSGGKERQDSVAEGIAALPAEAEIAAVHDAARPLASIGLIDAVIAAAAKYGGALAAVPMRDTVKKAKNGSSEETLPRESLWLAQTPQAFRVDIFKTALQKAFDDHFYGTDCSGLLERTGQPVRIVEGSSENMKITTPSDVPTAEAILKRMHV